VPARRRARATSTAVIVTNRVAAFAGKGSRIDVTVSSLGDRPSLTGGSLMLTP